MLTSIRKQSVPAQFSSSPAHELDMQILAAIRHAPSAARKSPSSTMGRPPKTGEGVLHTGQLCQRAADHHAVPIGREPGLFTQAIQRGGELRNAAFQRAQHVFAGDLRLTACG